MYYISISDTFFELHLFWPSDTERCIKLTFSESVSLSLKTRLMVLVMMTLLNMPQEMSNVCIITFKNWMSFEVKVYNKQIITTVT